MLRAYPYVPILLLLLLFLSLIPSIFFRLTVLIITAVDQIPLLDTTETCQYEFLQLIIGFLVVWSLSILVQSALIIVSLRGTILEDELRWHSEYLLYIKLGKYLFIHEVCPLPLLIFFPILKREQKRNRHFLTFPACLEIPIIFSNLNSDCSNLLRLRNLQEQVQKAVCYQKLF